MAIESFRKYCNKFKFYYFNTPKDFDKRIDYDGKNVSKVKFERGLVFEPTNIPTNWSAYGEM